MTEVVPHEAPDGLALLSALRSLGAATETSLDLPVDTTYEECEALGAVLGRAHRNVTWMIADWINHVEAVFPDRYSQAVEATNLTPETLGNYARTARKVPRERRVPGVPFSVHTEVAPLEPKQQEEWLGKAKTKGWKREELRSHLRPVKDLPGHASVEGEVGSIEEQARELVRSARNYGNDYLVRRYAFTALCAALGEEL